MPSYDVTRERFRLAPPHVGVLGCLHTGEVLPGELEEARQELLDIGLISDEGEISPVLADLVDTLSKPVTLVQAEMTGAQGILTHGAVVGGGAVFSHEEWPGTAESEYAQVEPATLVFELARMVGLRGRYAPQDGPETPPAPQAAVLHSTMGAVDAVFTALGELPPASREPGTLLRTALGALAGAPDAPDEETASALARLILALRSSWRMTVAWPGREENVPGTQVAGFAVWDCGPLGYWHRELPAEPVAEGRVGPESELKLVRLRPKQVWKMIAGLLPAREQIRFPEEAPAEGPREEETPHVASSPS